MNIMISRSKLLGCILALFTWPSLFAADGNQPVKIELFEPFKFTYNTEWAVLFVRLTNNGKTPLQFSTYGKDSDLQFENPPPASGEPSEFVPLWSTRFAFTNSLPNSKVGRIVKPGESLVLSQLDFDDEYFWHAQWEFPRIRPHFRVRTGEWVAGEWYERKILPNPDLKTVKSLYDYDLGSGQASSVVALPVYNETWLFGSRLALDSKIIGETGRVDRRLCRLPDGKLPISILHDEKERLLTIRFGGGEQDVVINTRTGMPVSGSERTVPHLHLWLKLAGRPFTDAYREWKKLPVPMPEGVNLPPKPPARAETPKTAPESQENSPTAVPEGRLKEP